MFMRTRQLQYNAKPDRPDPLYARKLQEVLGGQWGEISVMMTYLFQGWNCRGPEKYRDLIMDIGTEEIGHVEMLATMIARLLEGASPADQQAGTSNPLVGAVMGGTSFGEALMGGMNPQHMIVSGGGAMPADSVGYPWTSRYTVASGNLLADFRFNVTAESQGRLQVSRLYELTEDRGVRDLLAFLLARDTAHQNQWLAAIAELEAEGFDATPVPMTMPQDREHREVSYQLMNFSEGTEASSGRWAQGPSMDGRGEMGYVAEPRAMGDEAELGEPDPRLHGTARQPMPPIVED